MFNFVLIVFLKLLIRINTFFKIKENTKYIKFEIINEEKIYENKKTNLIYFHRTGFFMQISKGCIPYVIITELE